MYNFTTERYDYRQAILDDVRNYIEEEVNLTEWRGRSDDLEEYLNDTLWCEDSVTGNASGSYWFNAWKAEECICHNLDLLEEALFEFGYPGDYVQEHGAEAADITIRCYLLGECIAEVLEEYEGDLEEVEDLNQWVIISEDGEPVQKKDLLYDWEDVKDDEALKCFEHSFNDWYNNQLLLGEFIEIDEPEDERENPLDAEEFLNTETDYIKTRSELLDIYTLEEGRLANPSPLSFSEWLDMQIKEGFLVPIPNNNRPLQNMPWKVLNFSNGSNPYICWNREEWRKLNRKYFIRPYNGNPETEGEGTGFYYVVKTWREVYIYRITKTDSATAAKLRETYKSKL